MTEQELQIELEAIDREIELTRLEYNEISQNLKTLLVQMKELRKDIDEVIHR